MESEIRQVIKTVEGEVDQFSIKTKKTVDFPSGIMIRVGKYGMNPARATLGENRHSEPAPTRGDKFELEVRPGDEIAFIFDDNKQGCNMGVGTLYRDGQPYAAVDIRYARDPNVMKTFSDIPDREEEPVRGMSATRVPVPRAP